MERVHNLMRPYLLKILRFGLAVFLFLSSAAILYTTTQNNRSVQSLATQALESTALALSSSAENALRESGDKAQDEIRQILSDRVVAYALIASRDGKVLFHRNPRLVDSQLAREDMNWPSGTASGQRITLRTGLPAYEFNYVLHRPNGADELLRLVLHTTPADRIVSGARRMWWTVGGVLLLLWVIGIMLERVFTHQLRLREEVGRRQQLALIGQMTASLAHEIRNALGSIKGYAQWVDEKMEELDPKKAGLTAVLRGVQRIELLVNNLLLYSREEKYHHESLDLLPLLQETVHSAVSSWRGKIEMEIKPGTYVMADREKLHRALTNGVRNALQAMGEEGILSIQIYYKGQGVIIQIEDTGPGIPAAEMSRLFTPFYTTKTEGTGLGLAYSKKVIEGMAGKIELGNRDEGRGAILRIYLLKAGEN
jgi:two-component system sensor histidine kinase HydH